MSPTTLVALGSILVYQLQSFLASYEHAHPWIARLVMGMRPGYALATLSFQGASGAWLTSMNQIQVQFTA